jgi:cysteine desulfurase
MKVYLDNAATTNLSSEVLEAMLPYLTQHYGNPSSGHSWGKEARQAVETARQTIADLLNATPEEIVFTSGATEADNLALTGTIQLLQLQHVITSPLEHPAVLRGLRQLEEAGTINLHLVETDNKGHLKLNHLENLLRIHSQALVSLMHGNNEIGNLNDIGTIGTLCQAYGAIFHSDTVQTISYFDYNLQTLPVDFLVGSAHKFHGPKGAGFLFARRNRELKPLWYGGGQERQVRSGTENVSGIVGLAKALEIAQTCRQTVVQHLQTLKSELITGLKTLPGVRFNGESDSILYSLPTVLNVSLPELPNGQSLLAELDQHGIAASGGSACSSHSVGGSPVLRAIHADVSRENIRFSFSRYTTSAEVDRVLNVLTGLYTLADTNPTKTQLSSCY